MGSSYYIGGIHAVLSALEGERSISKIFVSSEIHKGRIKEIAALAKSKKILLQEARPQKLDEMLPDIRHQGIIALLAPIRYRDIEDMVDLASERSEDPFLVIVDGVEDPRNLGAIIRSAEAFGVHGVIIPKRGASPITPVTEKTAAGALERMYVAQVGNIAQEIERIKKMGIWVAGLALENGAEMSTQKLDGPIALVLGNEEKGISRLVRERCDFLAYIPMNGQVGSLNVSVAAGIGFYEVRQQRKKLK